MTTARAAMAEEQGVDRFEPSPVAACKDDDERSERSRLVRAERP